MCSCIWPTLSLPGTEKGKRIDSVCQEAGHARAGLFPTHLLRETFLLLLASVHA